MAKIKLHNRLVFLYLIMLYCNNVYSKAVVPPNEDESANKTSEQRYYDITKQIETTFKSVIKSVSRQLLPGMMRLNEQANISSVCSKSLMKYVVGLTKAKLWAVKMLDATSKLPSGILLGTFSEFGSFDECLGIEVRQKNGSLDFRGQSCAVAARSPLPPMPSNFSLAKTKEADLFETLSAQFNQAHEALHYKQFRFVVCVPSTCSVEDMNIIASEVGKVLDFYIKVPKCYVKEPSKLGPVHIALIVCLALLLILGIAGSIVESKKEKKENEKQTRLEKVLIAFSLSSNFNRLLSPSGGSSELKCIHGIRALGMCWIILGHTYVFTSFDLHKDPLLAGRWFDSYDFELIHNGWLSVETFFLLSGILVAYAGLKAMENTKGIINVPLLALRRYVRLTPPLLLLMGLALYLPLVSSGPFYYEHIDEQVESCRKYWWTTLLYFSNWWGIDKGCLLTTWYMAADFQLHILSLLLLMILFRYSKIGVTLLFGAILCSCLSIGIQTALFNLTPTIQLSSGNDKKVLDVINKVHINTLTHLGPHCIGMVFGYYIYKYREQKLNKLFIICGWCVSIILCMSSVLGSHRFSAGEESSPYLIVLYASLHRSLFIAGVAWVAFACITGCGGPVNKLLSSAILAPPSRLTFMVYLIHPLVIWVRLGSLRERPITAHYEFVYTYIGNVATSFVLAVPFYLLLEAPLANLDRLVFSKGQSKERKDVQKLPVQNENPHPVQNGNCVQLLAVTEFKPDVRPDVLRSYKEKHR